MPYFVNLIFNMWFSQTHSNTKWSHPVATLHAHTNTHTHSPTAQIRKQHMSHFVLHYPGSASPDGLPPCLRSQPMRTSTFPFTAFDSIFELMLNHEPCPNLQTNVSELPNLWNTISQHEQLFRRPDLSSL